ncbi:MAG TPA: glucoamylase family protein [Bacteroidales bacterium]|nr:glucoamylase family protein [Bacteroidales bacterium]
MKWIAVILSFLFIGLSCKKNQTIESPQISIESVLVNNQPVSNQSIINWVDFADVEISILFNTRIDTTKFDKDNFFLMGIGADYRYRFDRNQSWLHITPTRPLEPLSMYRLVVFPGKNLGGNIVGEYEFGFRTRLDSTPKFPIISDEELLTLVQRQTFRYFWDYAHPVSGLIRERSGSGDLVTMGGSGFGLMAILIGIERNFITRQEGFDRISTMVNFLNRPGTDRFHGAFPHWMNGITGRTIPFSARDDGADLVETAFLMQGLLAVQEYFRNGSTAEQSLVQTIQQMYENVQWNFFRRNNENVLYWHWSPNFGWAMNHQIRGWDESLMVYVLAAGSPTFSIPAEVYHQGWARGGGYPMMNGRTFFGIRQPLGPDLGGPLFFAHYSFLGLDPRNLRDQYAHYWEQNRAHTLINRAHSIANPNNFMGYSSSVWGLTASDIDNGYSASSPTNDLGVIAPTAALSSMPYTPAESMEALRFFYYVLGDKIWGPHGFYDAFNLTSLWFARSYLAIDQGPIIIMIENHRTGLIWDLFMRNENVRRGLQNLGFSF